MVDAKLVMAEFDRQHPNYSVSMGSVALKLPDGTVTLARRNVGHRGAPMYFKRVVKMAGGRFECEHHMFYKGRIKANGISRATEHDIFEWVNKTNTETPGMSSPYYLEKR